MLVYQSGSVFLCNIFCMRHFTQLLLKFDGLPLFKCYLYDICSFIWSLITDKIYYAIISYQKYCSQLLDGGCEGLIN